jgi:hypothetical protein
VGTAYFGAAQDQSASGNYRLEENSSMHRRLWTAVALLAFGYTLLPAIPAFAGYGAIAWDRATGKYGVSWNEPTAKRADEVALGECGASGCEVVRKIGPKTCAALATTADGKHAGAASRKDREAARLGALKACQKDNAGECIIRSTDCNK